MDPIKQRYVYFGISAALLAGAVLVDTSQRSVFIILSLSFFLVWGMSQIYIKTGIPQIGKFLGFLTFMRLEVFGTFLTVYGVSLSLIKLGYIDLGITVVTLDYIIFYFWMGYCVLGKNVLQPAFDRLNIFQPSVKIPKEFDNPDWRH